LADVPDSTTTDNAATVIIGQRVRPEYEHEFTSWQHDLNETASHYPGFLGAEVTAPTPVQPDWVVVYRFDSIANVQAWINSAARQDRLDVGRKFLDGPQTQQVVGGAAKPTDQLVTVVVSHRVSTDHVDEFLAWQDRLRSAEEDFEGFRGSEIFRPVEGVQEEWTTLYRYSSAEDLDKWMVSDRRRELLAEGRQFHHFDLRTVDNSFGSWFAFDDHGNEASPPSDTKTSLAVWMGLYPTVVFLTLALSPLHMPLWLGMLVGNLLSSFAMSFVAMPYYVNPLLKRWLRPPPRAPKVRSYWQGIGIIAALNLFWVVVFYLITKVIWHLP
jgi:antibiotic biosynthesis monooxygenase (ABM) superfamily enzyme